jgi:hypothetical protein
MLLILYRNLKKSLKNRSVYVPVVNTRGVVGEGGMGRWDEI